MKFKCIYENKRYGKRETVIVDPVNKTVTRKDLGKEHYDFCFEIRKDNYLSLELYLQMANYKDLDEEDA